MTTAAKVRRIVSLVSLLALLASIGGAWWLVSKRVASLPEGEYATLHLADPIELTEGDTTHRVSRVVVNFEKRTLTLERDELTFDDYGDATRTGGNEPLVMRVKFNREGFNDRFEIVPATRFDQQLRLVVFPQESNACRLIVLGKNDHPARIVELRRSEVVPDEFGNDPQPDRFHFTTLGHKGKGQEPYGIGVVGSLADGGQLHIDPNRYTFHADGSVGGTTLLAGMPKDVTFKPLGPDPANRGRRAFELVPKKADAPKETYTLVLGATEPSEHRLVIKSGGTVRQVLSLRNHDRDSCLGVLQRFKDLPADERDGYRELSKLSGYRGLAITDNKHIYKLQLYGGDASRFDSVLRRFPHLRELTFVEAALPATGLPCLAELKELTSLTFIQCELTDDGLASAGKATGLRKLNVLVSKGYRAEWLAHVVPIANLEELCVTSADELASGPQFDDGLKHLIGLAHLTRINLQGQRVTDAGLAHIGKLTNLRGLSLAGNHVTDDGLKQLEVLTQLTMFSVDGRYGPRLTVAGLKAFREKMPNLKKT